MNIKIKMRTKIKFKKVELSVTCILFFFVYLICGDIYLLPPLSVPFSFNFIFPPFIRCSYSLSQFFLIFSSFSFLFFSFLILSFDIYLNSLPLLHFFSFLSSILLLLLLLIHPIFLPSFLPSILSWLACFLSSFFPLLQSFSYLILHLRINHHPTVFSSLPGSSSSPWHSHCCCHSY